MKNKKCYCNFHSPIAFNSKDCKVGNDILNTFYETSEFNIINTGFFIAFEVLNKNNYVLFNSKKYYLTQFHFHNQNENIIDNTRYPLELHIVHENEFNETLVISIMLNINEYNYHISDNFKRIGQKTNINIEKLLPNNSNYYSFIGSFTTPPFTNNVRWLIFNNPINIGEKQVNEYKEYYMNNTRELQDINNRDIFINKFKIVN